jgi:hypothetical protein
VDRAGDRGGVATDLGAVAVQQCAAADDVVGVAAGDIPQIGVLGDHAEHSRTPHAALVRWINLFVDFLVTKHGLAEALQSDDAAFETLHAYFLDRLVPVCTQLLDAAAEAGEIRPGMDAYELLRGVANLCIGAEHSPRYDARRMVELVIAGLRLH